MTPRAGHICMICGFIPTTKNKYRELQDHLVRKHFNDRIKAALPTKRPYMCPEPSCTIEGKDWQALMRHFTGKHGVLERYLREIIDAGLDESAAADPKGRKVSTKSRLNPNGTAPAIQLLPEQIEQMEMQALAESSQMGLEVDETSPPANTMPGISVVPSEMLMSTPQLPPPIPQHKPMQVRASKRRKRPSINSTGSVSSPESLQEEDDVSGLASSDVGGGPQTIYYQPGPEPQMLEGEEKEQPQLALVFKRPKTDANGEDAYAFIDLKSFLASSTYISNAADLFAPGVANENVKYGVLAAPLSPPPEIDTAIQLPKQEIKDEVLDPMEVTESQPLPPPPAASATTQTQVVYASQEHHQQQFQMQQHQQQQHPQPVVSTPLPPPITTATVVPSQIAATATGSSTTVPPPPPPQQQQQQQQQTTTLVYNSAGDLQQFQSLHLDQHPDDDTGVVVAPMQQLPPHVEQQMLQAVHQEQQQTMVIQQAVDIEEEAAQQHVVYAPQHVISTVSEQFSIPQQSTETLVLTPEEFQQMFYGMDTQGGAVHVPVNSVQLPTEPVQIEDIREVQLQPHEVPYPSGIEQIVQHQPLLQEQKVVVEQVSALPVEVSTASTQQVHQQLKAGGSGSSSSTGGSTAVVNLQDVKEIDFSMF
jgi:hypothetical protein